MTHQWASFEITKTLYNILDWEFKLSNRKLCGIESLESSLSHSIVVLIVNQEMSDIDISQTAG